MARVSSRLSAVILLLLFVLAAATRVADAHEIPNDVTIQTFIKPDGERLLILVRAPLIAMRDMTWPFRNADVLDLARAPFELHNAATLWLGDEATVYEQDRALPSPQVIEVRATPAGDRSFESVDSAYAWLTGPPVPLDTEVTVKDGFLDILFAYPIRSPSSRFAIAPRWGRLGLRALTILRLVRPDGTIRTLQVEGDPGLVRLDPSPAQVAAAFANAAARLFVNNIDQLVFLFCLLLPFRRPRQLLVIAAAFIAAQTITIIAATYEIAPDALWFPPFINALVAVSIVYVAVENLLGTRFERRWIAAFVFGVVHGFAMALALLPRLPFAGSHPLVSALAFNAGIEVGVALFAVAAAAVLHLFFRYLTTERLGVIVGSAIVGHSGWHWMLERGALALQYQLAWPELTPAFLAYVVRCLMYVVAAAGMLWLISVLAHSRDLKSQVTSSK